VRVLRYGASQLEAALKAIPYDRPTIMKKGVFRGVDEDNPQLGVLNLLVAHARLDDAIAYGVAKGIIEGAAVLGRELPLFAGLGDLLDTVRAERCAPLQFDTVTLHPGAARFYAEKGYLAAR
jgi:TRAP-type uncharacterized transport system substrate-binding protein